MCQELRVFGPTSESTVDGGSGWKPKKELKVHEINPNHLGQYLNEQF